jgi:hypothetical protein
MFDIGNKWKRIEKDVCKKRAELRKKRKKRQS